jgi:hypothetical protein
MNEPTIQTTSTLNASTSRRESLRFLAALALTGSGLAGLAAVDADAKKNKNGKKRRKSTCDGRKPLARVKVSHDGSTAHTPKLENGRRYRLRVSGSVTGTAPLFPEIGVDAGYLFREDGGDTIAKDTADGLDFGLRIDGEPVPWGGYTSNHVYERRVQGAGGKLALRLVTESESQFSNSAQGQLSVRRLVETPVDFDFSGELTVEIFCD